MSQHLTKSKRKIIAGVCGGIAEWIGWDPTLVRVLYFFVSVLSAAFPGTIVYIVLWIVMPGPEAQETLGAEQNPVSKADQ